MKYEYADSRDVAKKSLSKLECIDEICRRIYTKQKETISEIAEKYPCSSEYVQKKLLQYDLDKEKAERNIMFELVTGEFA